MLRIAAGAFLALHGVVHAVGYTASWKVVESAEAPYTTAILNGTVDVGEEGTRLIGVLWLVAAGAMVAAAIQVWRRSDRALTAVAIATTFSLVMCVVGLPASMIGLVIDVGILAVLGVATALRGGAQETARSAS